MSKFNFQSRLEDSIANVYYKVHYVAHFIQKAQDAYDDDRDEDARDALEDAASLLDKAGEDDAACKVRYYKRFM